MITIRAEQSSDHQAIARIVTAAFRQPLEAEIVAQIRGTPAEVLSLVAEADGALAAHVLFSVVDADDAPRACALGPVAVDPPLQSRGIGDALIRAGIDRLRANGRPIVFVLGNPKYYSRFGFELAAPYGWHYGSREFDRAFQVMRLDGSPLKRSSTERWVRYHAAFS
jgi:putative acetyltransferase